MSDAPASEAPASATAAPAAAAPVAAPAVPAAPAAPAPAPAASTPAAEPGSLLTDDTQTTEKAPGADTPKEGDGKSAAKTDGTGAPAEYTEFTLPENVTMDSPVMDEFKAVAKETGLSQEAAQKMVTLAAKMQTNVVDKLRSHVDATAKEWETAAKADAEIGGAQFNENLGLAKKALDTFGTPELKTLLKESRMGSNPEVVRFMVRAGKAISQDGFVPGRAAAAAAKDTASVLYGSDSK